MNYPDTHLPIIWMVLSPTMVPGKAGPKHSTNVAFSAGDAVALNVVGKKLVLVFSNMAVKTLQTEVTLVSRCNRIQLVLPPSSLQKVTPLVSPATVHSKVMVSKGQVGGGGMNCPTTSSVETKVIINLICTQVLLGGIIRPSIQTRKYHCAAQNVYTTQLCAKVQVQTVDSF